VADRDVQVGVFPISIDFDKFARTAVETAVTEKVNQFCQAIVNCKIILGVDRLDYSKGIPQKLRAFGNVLERYPELQGGITLVQIVVPSRQDIPEYKELKAEIEGLVSQINGKFSQPGWVPVQYIFRSLEFHDLIAYYRAADIALVTSLKDGMNLVAKEYCAANVDNNGVLILSEFTGAAAQFKKNSLLVNPYDIEGVADAIFKAFNMGAVERISRMRKLRNAIKKRDIFWWVERFLQTATAIKNDTPPADLSYLWPYAPKALVDQSMENASS
ncbi:MAG: trehalose-6-phosphate synthase, partial [Dehalococcoidia bacterium]|nr:trehalose-6-phosphate synthase [Dehalococcoidia bacterium]